MMAVSSDNYAHPHPNICHWSFELPGLCSKPTRWSAYYYGDGRHSDWIANLCDDHAKQTLLMQIKCVVRDRWTKALYVAQ